MESTAKDYSQYLKAESATEVAALEETIENMLMRLEEFKGTIEMVKSERTSLETIFKEIFGMKASLSTLANRIDAMEVFISKIHQDMDTLEMQIIDAEQDYPNRPDIALKNLLKPIFSKMQHTDSTQNTSRMSNATVSSFEKVKVFDSEEIFKKN